MQLSREACPAPAPAVSADGGLPCSGEWDAIANMLDDVAAGLKRRMARRGPFSVALAAFIGSELKCSAAEIRANLALEELTACQNRLA